MLRPLEEFLWVLRRHGHTFGPAQASDAARAVSLVGWDDRETVRAALSLVLVKQASEQLSFDALFDSFFRAEKAHARDLFRRLGDQGLEASVVERLRTLLEALAADGDGSSGEAARALLGRVRGSGLDALLASHEVSRSMQGLTSQRQVGFFTQQVLARLGYGQVSAQLGLLRSLIEAEFGPEQGAQIAALLARELDLARSEVRLVVAQAAEAREQAGGQGQPFAGLDPGEVDEVRRAVRALGQKLLGAARVKARKARRGRPDARRTLRAAMQWGGVPMRLLRRARRRHKPRLWVLCDVSDSVRAASIFLLEFVAVAQDLFDRTRTFVFVSDVAETTALFAQQPTEQALAAVLGGGVVSTARVSNYGRALRAFDEQHGRSIDRRATVVIVGDGRSNFQDPGLAVVARLRERARAVLWLCPEEPARWGTGDSVMPGYARAVTEVLVATSAQGLEEAARALVRRR